MKEELSKEQREQTVEEYCEEKRLTALAEVEYIKLKHICILNDILCVTWMITI